MSQDLCTITAFRLSREMLDKLPKKGRSTVVRRALAYYFKAKDERKKIPVPMNEELKAMKDMAEQLRYIGHNLNQLCIELYLVGQGRGHAPTDWEVRELHKEIAQIGKEARSIIAFWTIR